MKTQITAAGRQEVAETVAKPIKEEEEKTKNDPDEGEGQKGEEDEELAESGSFDPSLLRSLMKKEDDGEGAEETNQHKGDEGGVQNEACGDDGYGLEDDNGFLETRTTTPSPLPELPEETPQLTAVKEESPGEEEPEEDAEKGPEEEDAEKEAEEEDAEKEAEEDAEKEPEEDAEEEAEEEPEEDAEKEAEEESEKEAEKEGGEKDKTPWQRRVSKRAHKKGMASAVRSGEKKIAERRQEVEAKKKKDKTESKRDDDGTTTEDWEFLLNDCC